ncbi:DNA polymerase III, chi subunit [Gemmobacter megaterium]|uniref:DNA polymerase III, chi subunit n=1 Tax=Gemmobacter megaterium TaxID=1086013 RepID=A0A1N7K790_9RHOB|nr:DNA polymerase III subunit chi [Gemmobacter megaterium]GGE00681.1 DNA polymerase III subunit chi [Gemmobacter megaterium]SIS57451.1 DNA polymerase III, chi subunit [Gemmobacter megaterium]
MGHALFFHLTRSSAEDLVRLNVTRALGLGWRVVIRGTNRAGLERLDERLWLHPEDSFLPHAMAGGAQDADQPVLLTDSAAIPNAAQALLTLDGAEVTAEEVAMLERTWIVFDGGDPAAMETARAQWRALTAAGAEAEYWSEASGRWQMQTAKRNS